jgi:hypothetical protein
MKTQENTSLRGRNDRSNLVHSFENPDCFTAFAMTGIFLRWLPTFLFVIITIAATGQTFVAETKLPEVEKPGFYRVLIDPTVMLYAKADLSNVRIMNGKREVPYITSMEAPILTTPEFKQYRIVSKKLTAGCCTTLIIENEERTSINNISLIIKNAETLKQATLLGSDDRETWYALKEDFYLNSIDNSDQTLEMKILNFPLANYQYLMLNINDSSSAPLNIVSAGYHESETVDGVYASVPNLTFYAIDSLKKTYVSISFDSARLVDKLQFYISGETFFHREAVLYEKLTRTTKKGKTETYLSFLKHLELTSTHESTLALDGSKVKDLVLEIENNDNPPLTFDAIEASQMNRYLTAWMEKNKAYSLKVGTSDMAAPVYDLSFFQRDIPENPEVLYVYALSAIKPRINRAEAPTIFKDKRFIWAVIIVVGAILAFMSYRMIEDSRKSG